MQGPKTNGRHESRLDWERDPCLYAGESIGAGQLGLVQTGGGTLVSGDGLEQCHQLRE